MYGNAFSSFQPRKKNFRKFPYSCQICRLQCNHSKLRETQKLTKWYPNYCEIDRAQKRALQSFRKALTPLFPFLLASLHSPRYFVIIRSLSLSRLVACNSEVGVARTLQCALEVFGNSSASVWVRIKTPFRSQTLIHSQTLTRFWLQPPIRSLFKTFSLHSNNSKLISRFAIFELFSIYFRISSVYKATSFTPIFIRISYIQP